MSERIDPNLAMQMATDLVIACLEKGPPLPALEELPRLVRLVRNALVGAELDEQDVSVGELAAALSKKRTDVADTVSPDWLICLEDGGRYKSLRRHLKARHGLTPEEYRRKWGLPDDYPMVTANYSQVRSKLARQTGFAGSASEHAEDSVAPGVAGSHD